MYAIYGAGGFGREVIPLLHDNDPVFIDDNVTGVVNGRLVVSEKDFLAQEEKNFNVAIANWQVRRVLAERLINAGAKPITVIAPDVIRYGNNKMGCGGILCAGTIITTNTVIGDFFHSNLFSYVAHDCVIGDYVTFAPRVCCNGNVKIGDHAYIGTGAVIRHGIEIGEGAVVGMGAVVLRDVDPRTTVIGNPARTIFA